MILLLLFFLLVSFICFYLYGQNNFLETNTYDIYNYNIPEELKDFKICHISDVHNVKSKTLVEDIVRSVKKEEPNIIAITGDLVDAHRTDIGAALDFVEKLKDVAPIYYVTGNHEAGIKERYKELRKGLIDLGVNVLENKTVIMKYNGLDINIVGINDMNMQRLGFNGATRRINRELDLANYNIDNYTILLAHRPEHLDIYKTRNIDLVLSGHFHGGQIRLFGQGFMSPDRTWFPEYTAGVKTKEETTMVLSRGIGNSLFPFRINNQPELVIVNLKK